MKSFLKFTLATIVGILIVHVFFFFLFIGVIGMMTSNIFSPSLSIPDNTVLHISLNQPIPDKVHEDPLSNFDFKNMKIKESAMGLNTILACIKQAATDDRIKGIYLDLSDINSQLGGLATIQEIRNALVAFKQSGKFIYSFSNLGYSQKSYYLASVADSVFSNPEAPCVLHGLGSSVSFYKKALQQLGIEVEVIRVGKFKAAVEPYTQDRISEENREQIQTYLNSLWHSLVEGISQSRNIPVSQIQQLANNFQMYTPEKLVQEGLFDGAIYEDQLFAKLAKLAQRDSTLLKKAYTLKTLQQYHETLAAEPQLPPNEKIAVIYAQGEIQAAQDEQHIGLWLAKTLRQAREDKKVKAIVLRVNSPGGDALTSEIIWREVKLAADQKPLIVSMGDMAASGGYYIACAADTIVAEPTTLTGSIGVFGLFLNGEELIQKKLGIHSDYVKTNEHSAFGGAAPLPFLPFLKNRPFTTYERNVLQNYIRQTYHTFLSRVSEGRGMTKEAVDSIGQGRVWTGADALKLGLVDTLGGLEDAIRLAAQKARLTSYELVQLPKSKNALEDLLPFSIEMVKTKILQSELGNYYEIFCRQKHLLHQGIIARVPYDMVLY